MEPVLIDNFDESHVTAGVCSERIFASMDELLESEWEELVIQFEPDTGGHVVRTSCCSMGPVC